MGRWGFELFQSDIDYDIASDLGHELDVELPHDPENSNATRDKLNDGRLAKKLDAIIASPALPDGGPHSFPGWKHAYVIMCAAAMSCGASISKQHMEKLSEVYQSAEMMYNEGRQTVKRALKEYPNNGEPYVMASPGLELSMDLMSAQEDRIETKWQNLQRCWWCKEKESASNPLLKCASCRVAIYCKAECQRWDWALHKKECKGATEEDASGKKHFVEKKAHDLPHPYQHHLTIMTLPEGA